MTNELKYAPLVSLLLAGALSLIAWLLGHPSFALGLLMGGGGGLIYLRMLTKRVMGFPKQGLAAGLRFLWAIALFLGSLKLGTPVFLGCLIGFFLYKPALVLLVAWDILRHTNRQ